MEITIRARPHRSCGRSYSRVGQDLDPTGELCLPLRSPPPEGSVL